MGKPTDEQYNACPIIVVDYVRALEAEVERLQQNEENIRVDMKIVSERNNANELLVFSHRTRNETLEAEVERLRGERDRALGAASWCYAHLSPCDEAAADETWPWLEDE